MFTTVGFTLNLAGFWVIVSESFCVIDSVGCNYPRSLPLCNGTSQEVRAHITGPELEVDEFRSLASGSDKEC